VGTGDDDARLAAEQPPENLLAVSAVLGFVSEPEPVPEEDTTTTASTAATGMLPSIIAKNT